MRSRFLFLRSFLDQCQIEQGNRVIWVIEGCDVVSLRFRKEIIRDLFFTERFRGSWEEIQILADTDSKGKTAWIWVSDDRSPYWFRWGKASGNTGDSSMGETGDPFDMIKFNDGKELGISYLQISVIKRVERPRLLLYKGVLCNFSYSSRTRFYSLHSCLIQFTGFCGWYVWSSMTQGQWMTRSGGKMVEGSKPGLKISVPRFDNSGLIASYDKTLIGRCMNPPKQAMKMLLFMLPRIWQVEGRVVGTDLGRGRFQFAFQTEEDIVEVLKMGPFHFDAWMISLVRWKPVVEANYPSKIIFWVYVLDIPLQFWAAQTFQSVGEALGKVHGEVDLEEGRVRVEVDGFKPLVFTMTIDFDEGVEIPVAVRYEKLVGYCSECFCMTHEQAQCPSLTKPVEEGRSSAMNQVDHGSNNSSYRGAVQKGREQGGGGREGQSHRYPMGKDGNKGKGLARDRDGYSRFEAPKYKQKDRFPRGNGEGSSVQGRQAGFHGPREQESRYAPYTRGNLIMGGGEEGGQVDSEKLMMDAFKGTVRGSKMIGNAKEKGVMDTASKARKALLFEEAPEADGEPDNSAAEMVEASDEKVKEKADTAMEDKMPVVEASVDADIPLEDGEFSDSELMVDTDDIQDWEQGEIEDYQEELEGEGSNAGALVEEFVEEQNQDAKDMEDVQEKDQKKKVKNGGKRTAMTILSPRKKLLAKAVTKMGGKGDGVAKKLPAKASKGAV